MDQNIKQKYQKYKYIVKKWEKNFKEKQGRVPSKYDIKEASKEIRDSYKMYYKLKTSFLEDTLGDILTEDGFDLENSQGEFSFCSAENDSVSLIPNDPQISLDLSALIGDEINESSKLTKSTKDSVSTKPIKISNDVNTGSMDRPIKEFEPVTSLDSNERAWSDDVSMTKKQTANSGKTEKKSALKSALNTKLFSSTSFSKRNPRKSLSRTQSGNFSKTSSQDLYFSSQELLPDLEAILVAKSQEKAKEIKSSCILDTNLKVFNRKIDQGWLNRCTSDDSKLMTSPILDNSLNENRAHSFGISNINLENVANLNSFTQKEKIEHNNTQISQKNNAVVYDSDSVVSNSEDESTNRINHIRHIRKKRRVLETISKNVQQNLKENQVKSKNDENEKNNVNDMDSGIEKEIDSHINQSGTRRKSQRNRKSNISYEETTPSDLNNIKNVPKKKSLPKNSMRTTKTQKSKTTTRRTQNSKLTKTKSSNLGQSDVAEISETNETEYNLDLGDGILNSLPRINIDELNQADRVAQEYINTNQQKLLKSSLSETSNSNAVEMKKKKLEMKIATGKLNENFVRIDMKKKIYVRGKRNMNYSRYKKKMWKKKKAAAALSGPDMDMGGCDGGVITCFICGQPGHFARNCKVKGDALLPLEAHMNNDDDSLFPTLEEAEEMAANQVEVVHSRNIEKMPKVVNELIYRSGDSNINGTNEAVNCGIKPVEVKNKKVYIGHRIPDDVLKKCGLLDDNGAQNQIGPLYSLNSDGSLKSIPDEVYEVLRMFGHTNFRKGQDKAIMRILCGLSTLVTLSTGSGKSLCYQLPAYLYSRKRKCLTLVVSPLVSLMEDQVHGVPHFLRAHCLHTNQTAQQKEKVLDMINQGEVDILLVSPEAIVAGEKSTSGFGSILRKLPPIAFACIDEVHCVSQWSHNFRPSYLMICKVLREKLKIHTILGLTATATQSTKESIIRHLTISDGESGVVSDTPLPDNLILSISKDLNRDAALVQLLKSERFGTCQSIIIYCTRRDECERIAGFIRTCFQDKAPETSKRKRINWYAEAYHAGMPASRRRTIQNAFMRNELRVIVATIAFGMGINKPDIRAIIHYNMPKAFENYVQEIGRAGRDGNTAHCHLFLDSNGLDQNELKRHIYANSFDRYVIRKLLQRIFVPCSCNRNLAKGDISPELEEEIQSQEHNSQLENQARRRTRKCPGHEIGFSIEETVEALDVPEENISTLLYYLELDGRWNIQVLSNAYVMCKVISYGGPKYLKQAAKECSPLAMAIALQIKNNTFDHDSNIIEFPVVDISSAIGWNSGVVKHQLKNLEWTTVDGLPKRSNISVNFFNLGFRVRAPGDLTDDELDEALDALYTRSVQQETTELIQLQCVYNGLSSVAYSSFISCSGMDLPVDRSNELKKIVRNYFQNDYPKDVELTKMIDTTTDDEIINDVLNMINMYPENQFTGRTLARIFHGIQSPNYPAVMWSRCKYWRAHSKSDFNRICKLANSVIVKMRT